MSRGYRYALPFQLAVPCERIEEALESHGIRYRSRVFDPATTIWTWMGQIATQDRSCRHAVSRVVAYHAAQGRHVSARTGAYVQARQKVSVDVLRELTMDLGRSLEQDCLRHSPLGRPVLAVDGTILSGPDTESIQQDYPQHSQMKPGLGFPFMRTALLTSQTTAAICDLNFAAYEGKGTGETTLFRHMWGDMAPGDVIVGDRAFGTFWHMYHMSQLGIDGVFRMKGGPELIGVKIERYLERGDRLGLLPKPRKKPNWISEKLYASAPDFIPARFVSRRLGRSNYLHLVSTIRDEAVTKDALLDVYRDRWDIELDIRAFKVTLGADILRCQTAEMIRKEIWATALTYNAVRALMARSAKRLGCPPRSLSFTGAMQAVEAFSPRFDTVPLSAVDPLVDRMLDAIGSHQVGNRSGREEPRLVKRRRKPIRFMTKPRGEYHEMPNAGRCD